MRTYLSVAWKELHELRWLWYAGVGVMVVLPLLQEAFAAIEYPVSSGLIEQVTLSLGAALAILVASSTACRDLHAGLEHFWRSRPMSLRAWVSVKLLCGWLVVISIAVLGIAAQYLIVATVSTHHLPEPDWALNALLVHGTTVTAVYALSFAIGAAVGRAVPAAFLSLLAALGLYFLPLVLPALAALDPFEALGRQPTRIDWNDWAGPALATKLVRTGMMLALTAVGVAAAAVVLWKQIRVRLRVRAVAWGVCLVLLLMFTVAAEQVGSNLTPIAVYDVPRALGAVRMMRLDGDRGYALTDSMEQRPVDGRDPDGDLYTPQLHLLVMPRGSGPVFGRGWQMDSLSRYSREVTSRLHWQADRPTTAWTFTIHSDNRRYTFTLDTLSLEADGVRTVHSAPLQIEGKGGFDMSWPKLSVNGDRLYVFFEHFFDRMQMGAETDPLVLEYDISDPAQTRYVRQFEVRFTGRDYDGTMSWRFVPAPSAEALAPAVTRGFTEVNSHGGIPLDDDHFVTVTPEFLHEDLSIPLSVDVYRDNTRPGMPPEHVGHRSATPLERLVTGGAVDAVVREGFLYVLVHKPQHGMIVFDLRDHERPRKVGHFAAPGDQLYTVTATTDGRIVLGGTRLYVFEALR